MNKKKRNFITKIWPWSEIHRLKKELKDSQYNVKCLSTTNMHLMSKVDAQQLRIERLDYEIVPLRSKIFIEPEVAHMRQARIDKATDEICQAAREFIYPQYNTKTNGVEEIDLMLLVSKRNTNN